MMLALSIHYSRASDLVRRSPGHQPGSAGYGLPGSLRQLVQPSRRAAGRFVLSTDALVHDSGLPRCRGPQAMQTPVEQLPESTLVYLLGSRYASGSAVDIAWRHLGAGPTGWARVPAICDFRPPHIEFGYPHARNTRRRWRLIGRARCLPRHAHLAVAAVPLHEHPARYCTGYLGDMAPSHRTADGFRRPGSRPGWGTAGTPSMRATTRPRNRPRPYRRGPRRLPTSRFPAPSAECDDRFKVWTDEVAAV